MLLRASILLFAGCLSIQANWILATEFWRAAANNATSAGKNSDEVRTARKRAAHYGYLRGDLWAEYARSLEPLNSPRDSGRGELRAAVAAVERALELGPHDGSLWFELASLEYTDLGDRVAALLKMSFYTAPDDDILIPARLLLAARSDALADPALRDLVRWEIRTVVAHKTKLRASVKAAFSGASPTVRTTLETWLQDIDPAMLK